MYPARRSETPAAATTAGPDTSDVVVDWLDGAVVALGVPVDRSAVESCAPLPGDPAAGDAVGASEIVLLGVMTGLVGAAADRPRAAIPALRPGRRDADER